MIYVNFLLVLLCAFTAGRLSTVGAYGWMTANFVVAVANLYVGVAKILITG